MIGDRVHENTRMIYSVGTQVVALIEISDGSKPRHPRGTVGVIVKAPFDLQHSYRVRFPDGFEAALKREQIINLELYKEGDLAAASLISNPSIEGLYQRVIFECIIGSQAYGLSGVESDVDRRGIYLPTAQQHWSLFGLPEQLENDATQEVYWELQKFLILALKANPNVLECLFSPLVVRVTELGEELRSLRHIFVTRMIFQTCNGYVMSQFKKMQTHIRNQGHVKWKHVMHLIRLLQAGIIALKTGEIPVAVAERKEELLAIKRGELPWEEVEAWRVRLHQEFDEAYSQTKLPERPDYDRVNMFLVKARRAALAGELP